MKTASGAFLLALVAFFSSIQDGKSALVLFEGEVEEQTLGGRPSLAGVKACKQQVEHVCPSTTFREDLLFEGVANKLTCLSEGRERLDKACFYGEMNDIVSDLVYGGPDQCRQEIRKKCGKQIDDLKKAIQHTEIIGTVKGAVDVVECLVQNSEDLWNKCKPNGKTVAPPQLQEVTVNRETFRCQFRLETMCPMEASKGMLGFEGAAGRLECLARNVASRNAAEVADQCLTGEMSLLLETIVSGGPDKCRQEIRKKCGKQIDDTKKAIEDLKIVDAAKRIVDLAQCLSSNAEDFWNKCKPEGPKEVVVDSQSTSFVSCKVRAEAMCPITSNMVVGLGFRVGCLAEHASQLGNECVQQEMKVELGSMDALQGSKCHDAIRSKCGKQIDQLKKAIQDTSVLGTLKSAVDVTQCIAQNAEELFNKCKPFEEPSTGCQTKMDMYCPNSLGLGQQLGCLAERAGELGSECMQKQAEAVMIKIDSLEGSKCQDELRNKCGKQIDQLKKAIRDNALFSILVGTVEVAQCLSQNAQDIADKCKPFTEALEGDCQTVCRASNDILGTGRQVACLADQATKIGEVCLRNEMQLAVSNLETFGDSKCKDEIRNKCGKQIDQFKKAIRDNALFSLVIGAFEVAQCLSQNAQEIAEKCRPFPATVCQTLCPASNDILGTGRQVACLADHSSEIGADCLRGQMALAADKMETFGESQCKDEIRNKCGKQIDQFKKAIRDNALFSLVIGAFEVSQCFVQNAQDIADKCRPFEEVSVLDCDGLTDKFCPVPNNKILGLGYHVGCLAEHVNEYIGAECVQRKMMFAMANLDALDGSKCHDEMRNKCGKQIDQLKKAIRETAIISIVKGAVDVAQCTAQNAEDLWNKCKPFQELSEEVQIEIVEDEQEPEMETLAGAPTSKKATKKPTKKSTSSPSKKATSKPSNAKPTSKPSNAKPTSKPTSKAISEAIFLGNEDDEDTPKMSVSHVEIDMDKCVRSARKFCSAQVLAVNESPFDKTLMDALNYCIEVNAAAIEAECVVKESNSWGLDNDRNPPHHRYPHDDDLPRPYPHGDDHPPHIFGACGNRHHHRHRHAATAAATSVFVFLVVLLVGRRVYLRRQQALSEDSAECGRRRHHHHHHRRCCCWWRRHHHGRPHHEESPMASASAYQRIKSDDAVAVPSVVVGNIV